MYIRGNKLIELLEEFQSTKPKKEDRIPYGEWRRLVKFLTNSKDLKLQVSTKPSTLIITHPTTKNSLRFYTGDYFIKFFQERPITTIFSSPKFERFWDKDGYNPTFITDDDGNKFMVRNLDFSYSAEKTTESSKNLTENLSKGSSNKMNINLNNLFDFGPINDNVVMYSPYGLAFRNSNNQYLTYNPTTKKTTDVTGLTIDLGGLIYKIPVGLNSVKPGDIIVHNGKPVCVEGIEDHSVICVDIENSELKTVIPPTNIFGFNYVTKITPLFNLGSANPSEDNPFGNIMPYLLFSTLSENSSSNKSGNGFDMQTLLLMSILNGNADGNFFGNIFGNGQA